MHATIGDRLHVHGNAVGHPDRTGEIVEVHGAAGAPPYLVRFDDGHTRLCFPGPDAVIEPGKIRGPTAGASRSARTAAKPREAKPREAQAAKAESAPKAAPSRKARRSSGGGTRKK
jgi:Domain of unknown function (DUF1918)